MICLFFLCALSKHSQTAGADDKNIHIEDKLVLSQYDQYDTSSISLYVIDFINDVKTMDQNTYRISSALVTSLLNSFTDDNLKHSQLFDEIIMPNLPGKIQDLHNSIFPNTPDYKELIKRLEQTLVGAIIVDDNGKIKNYDENNGGPLTILITTQAYSAYGTLLHDVIRDMLKKDNDKIKPLSNLLKWNIPQTIMNDENARKHPFLREGLMKRLIESLKQEISVSFKPIETETIEDLLDDKNGMKNLHSFIRGRWASDDGVSMYVKKNTYNEYMFMCMPNYKNNRKAFYEMQEHNKGLVEKCKVLRSIFRISLKNNPKFGIPKTFTSAYVLPYYLQIYYENPQIIYEYYLKTGNKVKSNEENKAVYELSNVFPRLLRNVIKEKYQSETTDSFIYEDIFDETNKIRYSIEGEMQKEHFRTLCSVSGTTLDILVSFFAFHPNMDKTEIFNNKGQMKEQFKGIFTAISSFMQFNNFHSPAEVLAGFFMYDRRNVAGKTYVTELLIFKRILKNFRENPERFFYSTEKKSIGNNNMYQTLAKYLNNGKLTHRKRHNSYQKSRRNEY